MPCACTLLCPDHSTLKSSRSGTRPLFFLTTFIKPLVLATRHLKYQRKSRGKSRCHFCTEPRQEVQKTPSISWTFFCLRSIVVSHPLRMRKALGSIPSVSMPMLFRLSTAPDKHRSLTDLCGWSSTSTASRAREASDPDLAKKVAFVTKTQQDEDGDMCTHAFHRHRDCRATQVHLARTKLAAFSV